jgi:predicted house-cleaning NTP pyrophosphatase (Maf/HAM1 superfamily)
MIDTATGETLTDCVQTDCQMRRYSDSEIERYLDDGSGSYKTHTHGFDPYHGYSIAFIESIVGNPLNITGVPTSTVIEMLKRIGYPI